MKLRSRITLFATVVITLVSFGISFTALLSASRTEIQRLDGVINHIAAKAASSSDPVGTATNFALTSSVGVTVAYITYDRDVTLLNESVVKLANPPSLASLRAAKTRVVTMNEPEHYRMRTVRVSDQQFVIIATSLNSVDKNRRSNLGIFFVMTLLGIGLGVIAINLLMRSDLRRIDQLITTADRISRGETKVEIRPGNSNTELDQLSSALHRMVSSLQHAIELEQETQGRMRRFLGDASHELRTPLTVIKGYVELLQNEEVTPDQEQRAYERLTTEILRMQSLINDLLMLTELQSRNEQFTEHVDLSTLAFDAVEDLRALDPERDVREAVAEDISVIGSKTLLAQLVTNLVGNVRRHTPLDAAVAISLRLDDLSAVLVIEDGGPG